MKSEVVSTLKSDVVSTLKSLKSDVDSTLKYDFVSTLKYNVVSTSKSNVVSTLKSDDVSTLKSHLVLTLKSYVETTLKSNEETTLKMEYFLDVEINNVVYTLKIGCSTSRVQRCGRLGDSTGKTWLSFNTLIVCQVSMTKRLRRWLHNPKVHEFKSRYEQEEFFIL